MRQADWRRVVRPVLPSDAEWGFSGSLCYRRPVEWVVLGVLGEGSSWDKDAYIYPFTMPTFVPDDVIALGWSRRIVRDRVSLLLEVEKAQELIRRALERDWSEEHALQLIVDAGRGHGNQLMVEAAGYAQVLLGEPEAAFDMLEPVTHATSMELAWVRAFVDRATLIRRLLEEGGQEAATQQLRLWSEQTITNLKLV